MPQAQALWGGTRANRSDTLGGRLEQRRLEHRARRLRLAIAALRERRQASARQGRVPRPLQQAIIDFSNELTSVEERLDGTIARSGSRLSAR